MGTTYAAYLNRFYALAEEQPFQMSDYALYFALIGVARSKGWPEQFQASNQRLLDSMPGMARQTLHNARERLAMRGLLAWEAGDRRLKAPTYRLLLKGDSIPPLLDQKQAVLVQKCTPTFRPKTTPIPPLLDQNDPKSDPIPPLLDQNGDNPTLVLNNNIYNNILLHHPSARESEADFFQEMANDEIFQEQLAMTLGFSKAGMTIQEIPELLKQFKTQCEMDKTEHADRKHARRHFRDWLRKEVKWRIKNATTNSNANNKNQRNADGASTAAAVQERQLRHGLNE